MHKSHLLMNVGLICAALTTAASSAQTAQPAPQPAKAGEPAATSPIIMEKEFNLFFENEPSGYFHEARRARVSENPSVAAASLHKAAAQFRLEAHRSTSPEGKLALQRCATELEMLASGFGLEVDKQPTIAAVDHAFARAHHTLAQHQLALAKQHWSRNMHKEAGAALLSACDNAHAACAWGAVEMSATEMKALSGVMKTASRAKSGNRVSDTDFTKASASVESQLKHLAEISKSDQWGPVPTDVVLQPDSIEAIWIAHGDEPTTQFCIARHAILTRQHATAAGALRRAEAFITMRVQHAGGQVKTELLASASDIAGIADDLEHDVQVSMHEVDRAFARVEIAMAEYFRERAKGAHAKNEAAETGHYLRAAATHLERGAAWTGHTVESGVTSTIHAARTLAGKLMAGAGWTVDEVGKGIDSVGKSIDAARNWVAPSKTTAVDPDAKP